MHSLKNNFSSHINETVKIGIPLMFSQLGQIAVGIADNVMIGRLGTAELAAASLANNIYMLIVIFCIGFTCIVSPLSGNIQGKKEEEKSLLKNALLVGLVLGIILETGLYLFSDIFYYMDQPGDIIGPAVQYFLVVNISTLPLVISLVVKHFIDGTGDTKTGMRIVLVGNVINIIFNYCFMYGLYVFPKLGLTGAAVGTLISRVYMCAAFFIKLKFENKYDNFSFFPVLSGVNVALLKKISLKGFGTGLQYIMEACAFCFAGIMMGWIGKVPLAAHQIAISLSSLGYMVYQSVGSATMIRIGLLDGIGERRQVLKAASASALIAMILSVSTGSVFYFFRFELPALFSDDADVIAKAAVFLIVLALFQVVDALQLIYSSATRGLADVRVPAALTFISYFMVSLPLSWYLTFRAEIGEWGIWWGFPAGLGAAAILFYFRFRYLAGDGSAAKESPCETTFEKSSA